MAHVSMAVYRLYGRREEYDALRELFARTIDRETPGFDDISPSARFCDLPVCAMHLEKLLKMEAPQPGGGSTSGTGNTASGRSSSTGGLPESAAARGGGAAVAGGGGGGAGAALAEQDGTQASMTMAMAMAGRQSRRRVEVDFPGFSNPSPASFPASSRDELLARGSFSTATAGASGATRFARPEFPPPLPGWGYPDRRLSSQALPPPSATGTRNTLPAPLTTSTPFDGLPQPQSYGAAPSMGLGMALGAVYGSAPAAGGFFDATSLAGARREQAAFGYSGEGVQQFASRGGGRGGLGGGGPGGSDTRDVAAAAWAGGNVQNRARDHGGGGDRGWEGGARGGAGADIQGPREGAQHQHHHRQHQHQRQHRGLGLEYSGAPAASSSSSSSLPAVFTSTVPTDATDAAAHHHEHRRSSATIAADFRGVNYGMLSVGGESSPDHPPPPAPDL